MEQQPQAIQKTAANSSSSKQQQQAGRSLLDGRFCLLRTHSQAITPQGVRTHAISRISTVRNANPTYLPTVGVPA